MPPLISMLIEAAEQVDVSDDRFVEGGSDKGGRDMDWDRPGVLANGQAMPTLRAGAAAVPSGASGRSVGGGVVVAAVAPPASRRAVNGAANWGWCTVAEGGEGSAAGGDLHRGGRVGDCRGGLRGASRAMSGAYLTSVKDVD